MDWLKAIEEFNTVTVKLDVSRGEVQVTWEYIGEGYEMDYDPEDPHDVPLLRFSVQVPDPEYGYGAWKDIDDGSYCTLMPVNAPKEMLQKAATDILVDVCDSILSGGSYKRDLEEWSWVEPSWYTDGAVIV